MVEMRDEGDGDPGAAAAPPPLLRHRGGSWLRSRQVLGFLPKQLCGEQGELQLLKLPPDPPGSMWRCKSPRPLFCARWQGLEAQLTDSKGSWRGSPTPPQPRPLFAVFGHITDFFLETFEKSVWWEMIGAAEAAFALRGFAPFCFIHPSIYFKQSRARNTPTISSSPQTPTVSRPREMFLLLLQLPHPFAMGYLCSLTRNSALSPLPVSPAPVTQPEAGAAAGTGLDLALPPLHHFWERRGRRQAAQLCDTSLTHLIKGIKYQKCRGTFNNSASSSCFITLIFAKIASSS